MSIKLPPANSPLRALFDTAHLASICHPKNRDRLPTFPQARRSAQAFIAADPAAKSVTSVCLKACGDLELVTFTRTSHKTAFKFGRL